MTGLLQPAAGLSRSAGRPDSFAPPYRRKNARFFAGARHHQTFNDVTNQEKKEWARLLFIHEKMTQKEIAEKVQVSEVTISTWVNTGNWGRLKNSLVLTKQEQLARLYNQVNELQLHIEAREEGKRFANSKEADVLAKLASAIKMMETEISLAEIINVFVAFNEFARTVTTIEEVKRIAQLEDNFIRQKSAA